MDKLLPRCGLNFYQANPSSWDWNTTKIYYAKRCDMKVNTTREVAFVNLDDCSPVTSRYKRIPSMDRSFVAAWNPTAGPTIPSVLLDVAG